MDDGSDTGSLGDGFRVYVRIVEWRSEAVLQVPIASLFRSADAWTVFRIEGDRARLTPVELGRRNAETAEVLKGVTEGDHVVAYPGDRVQEGRYPR